MLILLVSCTPQQISNEVQKGDLLFVGLPYEYWCDDDSMLADITNRTERFRAGNCLLTDTLNLIHVAILDKENDSLYVIDATLKRGVARYPFSDFIEQFTLHDGSIPSFKVCRLKNGKEASHFVENAKRFIGQPYDVAFAPKNGAMYCSELVRESYVTEAGDTLFAEYRVSTVGPDGKVAPYWQKLFSKMNASSPEGKNGTWPATMFYDPHIKAVDVDLHLREYMADPFAAQKDTILKHLGPKLTMRIEPRDITVIDAYYYSFENGESNSYYTFVNHAVDEPGAYGIFSEDSLVNIFASENHYRLPVDANVEKGVVDPSIDSLLGYWVEVQPYKDTFVFDDHWDLIRVMHILPDRVEIMTQDGIYVQNIMEFRFMDSGGFRVRLDGNVYNTSDEYELVDASRRVYRTKCFFDGNAYSFYIAPAVKRGETSFEVVEYAARYPELLDSYFSPELWKTE